MTITSVPPAEAGSRTLNKLPREFPIRRMAGTALDSSGSQPARVLLTSISGGGEIFERDRELTRLPRRSRLSTAERAQLRTGLPWTADTLAASLRWHTAAPPINTSTSPSCPSDSGRISRSAGASIAPASAAREPPVSEAPSRTRTFDQVYHQLRGPRVIASTGIGPFATQSDRAGVRNTPWWKPSILQSSPAQLVDWWKAHFGRHSTRLAGSHDNTVATIRSDLMQAWAELDSSMAGVAQGACLLPQLTAHVNTNTDLTLTLVERDALAAPSPRLPATIVRSRHNVLQRLRDVRQQIFGANDLIVRRLDSLLARGHYLPHAGAERRTAGPGRLHRLRDPSDALTGSLLLDHAHLVRAARHAAGSSGTAPQIDASRLGSLAQHPLSRLRRTHWLSLDRANEALHGVGHFIAAMKEPHHKLHRALGRQGRQKGDLPEFYAAMATELEPNEKIVLTSQWSARAGLPSVLVPVAPGVAVGPTARLEHGPIFRLEIEAKPTHTELKIGRGSRTTVAVGARVRLGLGARLGLGPPIQIGGKGASLLVGAELSAQPAFEHGGETLAYLTVARDKPHELKALVKKILSGDIDALDLMEAADTSANERRTKNAFRVETRAELGAAVSAHNLRAGPSAFAEAELLSVSSERRTRHMPLGEQQVGRVKQQSMVRTVDLGVGIGGGLTKNVPPPSGPVRFAMPLLAGSFQKQWDRAGSARTKFEVRFGPDGRYASMKTELAVLRTKGLQKPQRYPQVTELTTVDPALAGHLGRLQKIGKPITLEYGLCPEARKTINGMDCGAYGYRAEVYRIASNTGNWQLNQVWARHGKSYRTTASIPLPLGFGSAAAMELQKVLGRIAFDYSCEGKPTSTLTGDVFRGVNTLVGENA